MVLAHSLSEKASWITVFPVPESLFVSQISVWSLLTVWSWWRVCAGSPRELSRGSFLNDWWQLLMCLEHPAPITPTISGIVCKEEKVFQINEMSRKVREVCYFPCSVWEKSQTVSLLQFLNDLEPRVAASLCPQYACCFYKSLVCRQRDSEWLFANTGRLSIVLLHTVS